MAPVARRHGVLHGLGAKPNQRHGVARVQHAGRDQRRVFAEAVAGHHVRATSRPRQPANATATPAVSISGCVLVVSDRRSAGPSAAMAQRSSPRACDAFVEGRADHGVVAVGRHHADRLRTLAGENECEFLHSGDETFRNGAGPPQVKPPPTPSSITCCPLRMRPSRTAVSSASGIDAAEVLPCEATVITMLFHRQVEASRRGLQDADVGLMRHQPVQRRHRQTRRVHQFDRRIAQHAHGELEHGLPVHLQQRIAGHGTTAHMAGHRQDVVVAAIGVQRRPGCPARPRLPARRRRRRRRTARRCRGHSSRGCGKTLPNPPPARTCASRSG
jgi:hypothetical protein